MGMKKYLMTTIEDFLNESDNSFKKLSKNDKFIKDFFGSKVVDVNGNPLLMHHGGSFSDGEFKGNGWFTAYKGDARYYAKQNDGIVTSAYIVVKNPLYSGHIEHLVIKITDEILKSCEKRNLNIEVNEKGIISFIEANAATLIAHDINCDGVIDLHDGNILDVVVFSSDQILLPSNY